MSERDLNADFYDLAEEEDILPIPNDEGTPLFKVFNFIEEIAGQHSMSNEEVFLMISYLHNMFEERFEFYFENSDIIKHNSLPSGGELRNPDTEMSFNSLHVPIKSSRLYNHHYITEGISIRISPASEYGGMTSEEPLDDEVISIFQKNNE